jgi:hypothetical protein
MEDLSRSWKSGCIFAIALKTFCIKQVIGVFLFIEDFANLATRLTIGLLQNRNEKF